MNAARGPVAPAGFWGIVAAYLGAQAALALLLAATVRLVPGPLAARWSVRLIYDLSSVALLVAGVVVVRRSAPPGHGGEVLGRLWSWPGAWALALGAAAGIVLKYLAAVLGALERPIFPQEGTNNPLVLHPHSFAQPVSVAILFVAVAVAAPLAEELFFRGMLYGWLRAHLGLFWAVLLASMVFGLAHQPLSLAPPLAVIGAGLCLLYERWRSLWVPAAAHFAINVSSLVIALRLH